MINQPAGHLEPDESLADAALRETREETGWDVALDRLHRRLSVEGAGAARWQRRPPLPALRLRRRSAAADPVAQARRRHRARAVDDAGRTDRRARRHRSPLVWQVVADYLGRAPASAVDAAAASHERCRRDHRRHVRRRRFVGRGLAAAAGRRDDRRLVHAELGRRRQRRLPRRRRPPRRGRRLRPPRHPDPLPRLLARILGRRVRAFPRRIRAPAARRIRTCCATARSSSRISSMHARALGADAIATGHYARVAHRDGRWQLLRAVDRRQGPVLLPAPARPGAAGGDAVPARRTAQDRRAPDRRAKPGLPTAAKKDSTGICFIGERDFRDFLSRYLPAQARRDPRSAGPRAGRASRRVLFHARPARRPAAGRRARARSRRRGSSSARMSSATCCSSTRAATAHGCSRRQLWSRSRALDRRQLRRRRASPAPRRRATGSRPRTATSRCSTTAASHVRFDRNQRAVTPGQSLVLYDGDTCLGGAVIAATDAPLEATVREQAA